MMGVSYSFIYFGDILWFMIGKFGKWVDSGGL